MHLVNYLMEKGFAASNDLNVRNCRRETPLQLALDTADSFEAKPLIMTGARVNTENNFEIAPFRRASAAGHSELSKLLIEYGASVNGKDYNAINPLYVAL